ncbi:phage tail protein [Providencia rustigianii]|uniref:phage tail protein n=1 Tax=Providencia rustigianii TaxID=158850 RepID=UPI0022406B34|nr:phage tail protein [Providencia rustigianii]
MKYFALLTKLGENLLAQATALGTKLELTHMAVGDGGGSLPTPDTNQTKLIAEKRRAAINTLFIDDKNKNQIIAEQIIPEQDGGWWIREIGLFDKAGNLIAVANCPETYKPQLAEGSGRTQSIRMVLIVSHTESVTLKIDPSVVLATREYVNTEITVLDKKIDALSAQTKLDLNKKFDKANISGQKGNDNDKVPSLNLLTTEIGKLQPKGNYADKSSITVQAFNAQIESYAGEVGASSLGGLFISIKSSGGEPEIMHRAKNSDAQSAKFQNKSGVIAYLDDINKAIPIGSSIIWNSIAPIPENFWPNEGRSFSASEYPELAKIFPNLKLPDDRGYAIRIADNGRGIDAGRTVGTYQEDALQNIKGELDSLTASDQTVIKATGAFKNEGTEQGWQMGTGHRINKSIVSFDASRITRTANETRMKNVAKILITRVK